MVQRISASADDLAFDLDQFYTKPEVAAALYGIFQEHFDPMRHLMVEPTAGDGAFFRLLPPGSLGIDRDPKYPGIEEADFLEVELRSERPVACIGNPPYGRNSNSAVSIFNHAAHYATVNAFILPKTFRKWSIIRRLNLNFHLLHEVEVPDNAFIFRSKPFHIPAVFQIWERRPELRPHEHRATVHPDFEFTTADRADFAIQRVGARAGRVHHDFSRSARSHYFIRGDVEHVMRRLDFSSVTRNVAGNPSLSKREIVALYRARVGRSARARAGRHGGGGSVAPSLRCLGQLM